MIACIPDIVENALTGGALAVFTVLVIAAIGLLFGSGDRR